VFLLFEQKEEEHCTATVAGGGFCVKFFSEAHAQGLECIDEKISSS
jgi:hypothetical protein